MPMSRPAIKHFPTIKFLAVKKTQIQVMSPL